MMRQARAGARLAVEGCVRALPACWYTDGQERWDCDGDECAEAGERAIGESCQGAS